MKSDSDKDNVKIAIRWRPAVEGRPVAIQRINEKVIGVVRRQNVLPKTFVLDYVFDSVDSTQSEVYDVLVKPLVDKAFDGYDATLIAIGQTGSGKTYTVGFESSVTSENNGMTARVLDSVFSYTKRIDVSISFIEIYNDQAFDLLSENAQEAFYKKDHRCDVATKKPVDKENVLVLLSQAVKRRRVRGTNMNSVSSRSHAVLTIFLSIDGRESAINLVDLAGSEGFQKTGNTGDAHMEGKSINESLSAFKRVINAMVQRETYIPFRDAVITTLLKKSLNTRSYLTLLGCVSPYQDDFGETLSTARFVYDAKKMKATPQQNAIINEFQKSKTPKKVHLRTSNLALKSTFKKPLFMSSFCNRNKQPSKIPMSEPRKNLSINPRSNESVRLRNSTTKKSNSFRPNLRTSMRRSRAVSSLFAPTTISRQLIEDSLQTNELLDWQNVSTSSVLIPDQVSNQQDSKLDEYMNLLMNRVKLKVVDKMKNNPTLNMFEVVASEITDISKRKSICNGKSLSPRSSLSKMGELSRNKIECNDSQIDFANISVDINQTDKQILVGVSTPLPQNVQQISHEISNIGDSKYGAYDKDSYISLRCSTRLTRTTINTTPVTTPVAKRLSFECQRTPIGVIRLRKISTKTETPELNMPDNETYEIVIVNDSPQICEEHFESMKEMEHTKEYTLAKNYPLKPINCTIASKTTPNAHPFPLSPRIILQRINSLDEYQRSVSIQPTPKVKAVKTKRNIPKTNVEHTKRANLQNVSTDSQTAMNILNLLNTGTAKAIQGLWTIGAKTATAIYNHRVMYGDFKSIDELEKMPFWDVKKHQRFLEKNGLK